MSENPHVDDLLGAFMDGELDAAARARVERHLHSCERCAEELEALVSLQAGLRQTGVPEPGPAYWSSFAARVQSRLPAAPARTPWVERITNWFAPAERIAWVRVAGTFAVVTLVTYVGMHGFDADRVRRDGVRQPPQAASQAPVLVPPETSDGTMPPAASEPESPARQETEVRAADRKTPPSTQGISGSAVPAPALEKLESFEATNTPPRANAEGAPMTARTPELTALTDSQAVGAAKVTLAERSTANQRSAAPIAGTELPVASASERRAQLPHAETLDAAVRTFVAAALAGDTLTARAQRDVAAASAAAATEVQQMDAWLRAASPQRFRVNAFAVAPTNPWTALDALVWPRREQPALRPHAEELARRLAAHAEDPQQRERAAAYAEWLARTSTDAASRAAWQATLEALRP